MAESAVLAYSENGAVFPNHGMGSSFPKPNEKIENERLQKPPPDQEEGARRAGPTILALVKASLDLRFDVLIQGKEVLRVVFLLDGHEPVVVGTERGFDRVFPLLP
jgi:hypothetical protein